MRNLFSRLSTWWHEQSRAERHRRRMERTLALPLRELSPVEAAEVARIGEAVIAMRTGEFPLVSPRFDYLEPIGPKRVGELTVDERWQLFEADPLGAVLPGQPAKDNVLFAEVHAALPLSKPVAEDLELTRGWEIGQLARFAQMGGKR
jgi:hypothetical protein